jgi:rSAM/selenodomain-associated transferase 1
MGEDAIIIFVRNPERGKVKTRLAATIGDEAALRIYKRLLQHTHTITSPLGCDKFVYYAGTVEEGDLWTVGCRKRVQQGDDLGEKMKAAFAQLFDLGYSRVCIVGSDCPELTTGIIERAFNELHAHDVVIGPAMDGGYYLLGMKEGLKNVFDGVEWSTAKVLDQTKGKMRKAGYSYSLLPLLRDVDTADDLPEAWT